MRASILAAHSHANERHNITLYYLSLEARQAKRSPFAERALSPQAIALPIALEALFLAQSPALARKI
ncbi:hypothetical protein [Scytonema sp. HK-05]|uniref:hypothetical protein n=1 Tax=Scytonema sp. HK-05 TaxID=1137095 RepID=UPI000937DC12|nr:hypothetical protein [Scytonema sp. HK-05]OKH60225.1 hypothetical protein NIES2130_03890 [Scytonema sp. HK-05]